MSRVAYRSDTRRWGSCQLIIWGPTWRSLANLREAVVIPSAAEGSAVASFRDPRIPGIYNFPVGGDPTEAHQDQIAISQSRFSEQHGKCVSSTCLGRSAPERGRSTSRKSDRTGGVRADCDGIGSLTLRSAIASQEQGPILLTQLEARLWDLHALPGAREPRQPTTQPGTAPPALR